MPKGPRDVLSHTAPQVRRILIVLAATSLVGCASDSGERVAGAALLGGAMGIPAGPIGIGVGAGVGAAAGALTPKDVLEGQAQSAQR